MGSTFGDKALDYVWEHFRDVQAVVDLWALANKRAPDLLFELGRDAIREWDASSDRPPELQVTGLERGSESLPSWQIQGWTELDPFFVWNTEIDFVFLARGEPRALGRVLALEVPCGTVEEHARANAWAAFIQRHRSDLRARAPNVDVLEAAALVTTKKTDSNDDPVYFPLLSYRFESAGPDRIRDATEFKRLVYEAVDAFTRQLLPVLRDGPGGKI